MSSQTFKALALLQNQRNKILNGMLGQISGVSFNMLGESNKEDLTLSQGILAALQACERALGESSGDRKLEECLAQLSALKLVLALHGIVYERDIEKDPVVKTMLESIAVRWGLNNNGTFGIGGGGGRCDVT